MGAKRAGACDGRPQGERSEIARKACLASGVRAMESLLRFAFAPIKCYTKKYEKVSFCSFYFYIENRSFFGIRIF